MSRENAFSRGLLLVIRVGLSVKCATVIGCARGVGVGTDRMRMACWMLSRLIRRCIALVMCLYRSEGLGLSSIRKLALPALASSPRSTAGVLQWEKRPWLNMTAGWRLVQLAIRLVLMCLSRWPGR